MFRKREARILLTGLYAFWGSVIAAWPAAAAALAPHRAVYDLVLDSVDDRSGIDGMYGRMVYEFSGSDCVGYSSKFRFVTAVASESGQNVNDQRTVTYEDLSSGLFRFETKSYSNDVLSQEVRGEATHAADGVDVTLNLPESRELSLAGGRFPTEHIQAVLERAAKGEHFFESRIFDGSDDGDKTLLATVIIGEKGTAGHESDGAAALDGQTFWPVSIAYFNDSATADDEMPIYNMSFKLYENGISRDLTLDYGDFVLKGRIAKLDMLEEAKCGR